MAKSQNSRSRSTRKPTTFKFEDLRGTMQSHFRVFGRGCGLTHATLKGKRTPVVVSCIRQGEFGQ
jgi:hypothetical protein